MINSKKKGFTIVELVIVIAVVAILAAVLIPTFSNLVKKANLSADQVAVKNINTLIATEFVGEKPESLKEIVDLLDENGYDVDALEPLTEGYKFAWNKAENKVYLLTEAEAAEFETLDNGKTYINEEVSTAAQLSNAISNGKDVTLTATLEVVDEIMVNGDVTIDMNGYNIVAPTTQRPFLMSDGSTLTINAEGQEIRCR